MKQRIMLWINFFDQILAKLTLIQIREFLIQVKFET